MKNLACLLFLLPLVFISCNNDDDCIATDLSTIIVGKWEVEGTSSEIEFLADGTFIDNDQALVFNPDDEPMEYFVDSETMIRIRVIISTPAEYLVPVESFNCNEINMSVAGLDVRLDRE